MMRSALILLLGLALALVSGCKKQAPLENIDMSESFDYFGRWEWHRTIHSEPGPGAGNDTVYSSELPCEYAVDISSSGIKFFEDNVEIDTCAIVTSFRKLSVNFPQSGCINAGGWTFNLIGDSRGIHMEHTCSSRVDTISEILLLWLGPHDNPNISLSENLGASLGYMECTGKGIKTAGKVYYRRQL